MNASLVQADETDHIDFYCPVCKGAMLVEDVETKDVQFDQGTYRCTFVKLTCPKHGPQRHRKFYWHVDREPYESAPARSARDVLEAGWEQVKQAIKAV